MVRKKTALGRSVRKTEKRKIARAALMEEREREGEMVRNLSEEMLEALTEEREREREAVRNLSEEMLSGNADDETYFEVVSEKKRERSVRSGGDHDRKRLRKDAGDRMVSPVRKSSISIVRIIERCTLKFICSER